MADKSDDSRAERWVLTCTTDPLRTITVVSDGSGDGIWQIMGRAGTATLSGPHTWHYDGDDWKP